MEQRPNPETLLKRAQEEERQEHLGKLKIYLGAAPGVGKTYTMLTDALLKRSQGLDVVVGVVESHGRREIENMLIELDILPRQLIDYRGQQLAEFDLDAALKRNPGLILIDEMAHTNAPGLRHEKRWQDIKEILDRGIDVYTTLNVQHIESLNDVVTQIIGIRIKETVPDSTLELADTIELVDLPPEDLLKRLQEGKIYIPQQAGLAVDNFFRKGNLIALRELALRYTAERVEAQVLLYRYGQGIERIWPTKERILVCIGPGPEAIKIIRAAKRMSISLQAEWIAVYVETPRYYLSEADHNNIAKNLRFAEQLGAETHILNGFDVIKEIINFAHERNVTKMLIWKKTRSRWHDILFSSYADELVRQSGEIDVHIITGESEPVKASPPTTEKPTRLPWLHYGIAITVVTFTTVINYLIHSHVAPSNLIMVYLLGVVMVSMGGYTGPSIVASVLSVLAYAFFFTPPNFAFEITDIQYSITLVIMLIVAITVSHLTIITRRQAKVAHLAARRAVTLHALSRQLAHTRGIDKLLTVALRYISEVFDSEVIALLPENHHLYIGARYHTSEELNAKELSVAQWVYSMRQAAGLGTDTLTFSDAIYIPMLASDGAAGVLRVRPIKPRRLLTPEQMHLLEACANQLGLAIEVDRLQEQANQLELQAQTDRVRNLLQQLTHLEAETVSFQIRPYSLKNLLVRVTKSLNTQLSGRPVHIRLPKELPKIPFDKVLIEEVFLHLLDNAIKYSPATSPIDISAYIEKNDVVVSVEDRGPGIGSGDINKLFEKFYRGQMFTNERGLGLGLSICRTIIQAHGGEIWVVNRVGGGATFCFTLPLGKA